LQLSGHAIEARIYAENTDKGFLPSVGRLMHVELPEHVDFANGEVRVDSGVRCGDEISPYYDPMIAKLIVWGATREQARLRMLQALARTQIAGVHTNVDFLSRLIGDEAFASADLDTGLIERRRDILLAAPTLASDTALASAVVAVLIEEARAQSILASEADQSGDPWSTLDGWRLNGDYRRVFEWLDGGLLRQVSMLRRGSKQLLEIDGRQHEVSWTAIRTPSGAYRIVLVLNDSQHVVTVCRQNANVDVFVGGKHVVLSLHDPLARAAKGEARVEGGLTAPMPGKIIAVHVQPGQRVKQGAALLVMEAMKMEHAVFAPVEGVVKEVLFDVGEQVNEGAILIELE
jgi:3-methylcrotonyl-CoA carboxylase alpha subunit